MMRLVESRLPLSTILTLSLTEQDADAESYILHKVLQRCVHVLENLPDYNKVRVDAVRLERVDDLSVLTVTLAPIPMTEQDDHVTLKLDQAAKLRISHNQREKEVKVYEGMPPNSMTSVLSIVKTLLRQGLDHLKDVVAK